MSVLYKLYQDTRKNGTQRFYARAVQLNIVDTKKLASLIEEKCTLTHADIVACISALVSEMRRELQNSNTVKLDGFGSFRVGIKSTGADDPKLFNANENIQGMKVKFLPAGTKSVDGKVTRSFLAGATVKKYE